MACFTSMTRMPLEAFHAAASTPNTSIAADAFDKMLWSHSMNAASPTSCGAFEDTWLPDRAGEGFVPWARNPSAGRPTSSEPTNPWRVILAGGIICTFVAKRSEIVLTLQASHARWLDLEQNDGESATDARQVLSLCATLD